MNEFAKRRTWGPTPRYPRVEAYEPPSNKFVVIGGPCSVESGAMIHNLAILAEHGGATHLRGGVFRAGTYPSLEFGYRDEAILSAYYHAAQLNKLQNIIEVLDYDKDAFDMVSRYCTAFQVGARQMQNYTLLRCFGHYGKPVFLKRNPGATIDEWLGAAEHLLAGGVKELYLIERGSSTHMNHVRWDLSISIIPAVQAITKIPVIVDGSHGTGRRDLVGPMILAGVAAGAGGLLCEMHERPSESLSDPDQAVTPQEFDSIVSKAKQIREVIKWS